VVTDFLLDISVFVNYSGHKNSQQGDVMEDFQQILPVTKVKRHLLDILKRMEEEDATIALTRNGEPVGVMMTPARYEALLETIEILGDKEIMRALEQSTKDFKSGKVFTDEEAWGD
jgi:prevent-host-death family protein